MKSLIALALAALCGVAHAEVITITPSGGGTGGGITGPGTTGLNNLVTWSSPTGASIADSGIAASQVALLNVSNNFTHTITVQSATQYTGFNVYNGTNQVAKLWGGVAGNDSGVLNLLSGGTLNISLNSGGNSYIYGNLGVGSTTVAYPLDVTGNIRTTTGLLINGSTVIDTIQSGNTSAQARTITFPNTGNATDTLALLAAGQTFSGANTFSGATTLSGSMLVSSTGTPATFSANGQVEINAGTTVPTFNGTYPSTLSIGGYLSSAPSVSGGGGAIYTTSGGMQLQSTAINFVGATGTLNNSMTFKGLSTIGLLNYTSSHIWDSATAPTWNAGFGGTTTVGTQNGTRAFQVTVPGSPSGSTGTVNLPAANTEWNCFANDKTNPATVVVAQTGWASTTAQFTAYSRTTGLAVTWTAGDVIEISCPGGL